jgi:hypothetical protein
MYSKELRQQFWTKFGQYMKPVPGAGEEPVNWLNYKTGKPYITFRMDADKQRAIIAIEINHKEAAERENCYQHFFFLKRLMENETGFVWQWKKEILAENGEHISSIYQTLQPVNVLNENDWHSIIAFLKPRIIALDSFWEIVKDGFE